MAVDHETAVLMARMLAFPCYVLARVAWKASMKVPAVACAAISVMGVLTWFLK